MTSVEHASGIWQLEDDEDAAHATMQMIEQRFEGPFRVFHTLESLNEALKARDAPSLLVADDDIHGRSFTATLRQGEIVLPRWTCLISISTYVSESRVNDALSQAAYFLPKPFEPGLLVAVINNAFDARDIKRRDLALRSLDEGSGPSRVLEAMLKATGVVFSREELLAAGWGESVLRSRTTLDRFFHRIPPGLTEAEYLFERVSNGPKKGWRIIDLVPRPIMKFSK